MTPYPLLLCCFFLSGLAGLLYQTAWAQQLVLLFGASEPAVVTVLAAYMAGLALGAGAAARTVTRVRRPVLAYGVLELLIGAGALLVPAGLRLADEVLQRLAPAWTRWQSAAEVAASLDLPRLLFTFAAAFLVLLPATACMGATLPLLVRHAVVEDRHVGERAGALYGWNTLGAAAGAFLGSFVLLPRLGLTHTVTAAVIANLLVFVAAFALRGAATNSATDNAAPASGGPPARRRLPQPMLVAIALSGALSFTYEVLWTRLLGQVFGGSVYAFGTMLATFLLGLALGAGAGSRLATSPERARRAFAAAQFALAGAALGGYLALPAVLSLPGGIDRPLPRALAAAALLLPSTIALGATLPLAVRALARTPEQAAVASARCYAWNTAGAIVGASAGGFFMLPALGYASTVRVLALASLAIALVVLATPRDSADSTPPLRARSLAGLAAAIVLGLLLPLAEPWGLLRHVPLGEARDDEAGFAPAGAVRFFAAGRSANVLLVERGLGWRLSTNGLPESLIGRPGARPGELQVARWMALLPAVLRPEARTWLVVGRGGGVVLEALPAQAARVDVAELEPQVIAANRAIGGRRRRDPLRDQRLRLIVDDARAVLRAARGGYDVVVSQPSHPWTAASSHLFTREFYQRVRQGLAADGVLVQWIGLAFTDEVLLRSLAATLLAVFDQVEVYLPPGSGAALFVAAPRPLELERALSRGKVSAVELGAAVGVLTIDDLLLARLFDAGATRAFAGGARISSDRRNPWKTRAPRILDRPLLADGLYRLALAPPLGERLDRAPTLDLGYAVSRLARHASTQPRAENVARRITVPADRQAAEAAIALGRGDTASAQRALRAVLAGDPGHVTARALLLRTFAAEIRAGARVEAAEGLLDAHARSVVGAWRMLGDRQRGGKDAPAAIAAIAAIAIDAELGRVPPAHPLFSDALRARLELRLTRLLPLEPQRPLELAEILIGREPIAAHHLLRARLALAAGDAAAARASLGEAAPQLAQRPDPDLVALARELRQRLSRAGRELTNVEKF